MINRASIDAVRAARKSEHFARPRYDGFGFAALPSLLESLLLGRESEMAASVLDRPDRPRALITILLDGFGWSFFERFREELPFLRRVVREGVASMLSAQFPTTTAAHVTTLHTGWPVGASGVFEWQYFEPSLGAIFLPLPAVTVGATSVEPVAPAPGTAYPDDTFYASLAAAGVPSFCYQSDRYATSTYSRAATRGASVVPFRTLPEGIVELVDRVRNAPGPRYHCVYFDVIDTIAHRHGPDARHLAAEIKSVFHLLEDQLTTSLAGTDTLILITADHGHIAVDPTRTVHLDEVVPDLPGWIATNADGRLLAPAGSSRDQFLYVRPEHVDEAETTLTAALEGVATVHRVSELVKEGIFGRVEARLQERLAPLVVLPRPHETVWWSGVGRFVQSMWGHHGGLSRDELEIPLLAWRP